MAKIWAVYEGQEPTLGGPWAHLPALEAIDIFELQPEDHVSDLAKTPRFGAVDRGLTYAGFKHIVVEIGSKEGQQAKWLSGFYKSKVPPKEAIVRLTQQAVVAELGAENVVRLSIEPTTDSQGREALKVKVVISPGATDRLEGSPVLDALVRVQERFRDMRESRIPMIEYITEAELEQDGSPQS